MITNLGPLVLRFEFGVVFRWLIPDSIGKGFNLPSGSSEKERIAILFDIG
jgi:hypothetical protein